MPAGKCLSKVTTSVEATVSLPTIAASSPGPTRPSERMKVEKSSMSCLSPMSPMRSIGCQSGSGFKHCPPLALPPTYPRAWIRTAT